MSVAGASQYRNAAVLANTQGLAAQAPTLLSQTTDTMSLLASGRNLAVGGLGVGGLSASARAVNQSLLAQSSAINGLFSLGAGGDATIDGALQQILAIRAGLSDSQLAPSLRGQEVDTEA